MRISTCVSALSIAILLAACGKSDDAAPKKEGDGSAQPAGSGGSGGSSAAKPDDKGSAAKPDDKGSAKKPDDKTDKKKDEPAPVTSKIKEARCSEPCLMLTDTPLDKLPETYKSECKKETKELGFEDCKTFDYTRNCIYAAHGLVFKKKKWKVFEKKPWYEATPAFRSSNISKLERKNVHELLTRASACNKGLLISGADYERVNTWFSALPKKPADMPAVIFVDDQKSTADELVKWLGEQLFNEEDLKAKKRKKFKFDKKTVASYDKALDDVIPAEAMAAIKAPKGAKLRSIFIDTTTNVGGEEGEITEGVTIRFVYTDKNKLMAVVAQHYLND